MRRRTWFMIGVLLLLVCALLIVQGRSTSLRGMLPDGTVTIRDRVRVLVHPIGPQPTVPEIVRAVRQMLIAIQLHSTNLEFDLTQDGVVDTRDRRALIQGLRSLVGARCGDGEIDPGEQCDDSNLRSVDGCSSTCQREDIHAECVQYQCQAVLGSGANLCRTQQECAPTYGMTIAVEDHPSLPISPGHSSTITFLVSADAPRTNMLVQLRLYSMTNPMEKYEHDSRCTSVNAGRGYGEWDCVIPSIAPGSPVRLTFEYQPDYLPNCQNMGDTIPVFATIAEHRSYGPDPADVPPVERVLFLPFTCLTTASLNNIRMATIDDTVQLAACDGARIGNGYNDFRYASTWFDDLAHGVTYIYGVLTGNVNSVLRYDHETSTIHFSLYGDGSRSFIRDTVWDPVNERAYNLTLRYHPITNVANAPFFDIYNPQTNEVLQAVELPNVSYSDPFRRPVIVDGTPYFFETVYNNAVAYIILAFNPSERTFTEVYRSADLADAQAHARTYPSSLSDAFDGVWQQCFARRARIPLQ